MLKSRWESRRQRGRVVGEGMARKLLGQNKMYKGLTF